MRELKIKYIGLRDWLELGQALNDRCLIRSYRWFRKWHSQEIQIGVNCYIYANGKKFRAGRYMLHE